MGGHSEPCYQIDRVEEDAQHQRILPLSWKEWAKAKPMASAKSSRLRGRVGGTKCHVPAANDREQAARLQDQLARTTRLSRTHSIAHSPTGRNMDEHKAAELRKRRESQGYFWWPFQDQRGMVRPTGTSSGERWYRFIVVVVAQAK